MTDIPGALVDLCYSATLCFSDQVKLQEGLYLWLGVRFLQKGYTCQCWPTMNQTRKIFPKEGGFKYCKELLLLFMSGVVQNFLIYDRILGCCVGKLETGTTLPKFISGNPPKMTLIQVGLNQTRSSR